MILTLRKKNLAQGKDNLLLINTNRLNLNLILKRIIKIIHL